MKLCLLTCLLPIALGAQPPPAPNPQVLGSISGKLLNGVTDEPVRSATLTLFGAPQSRTVTTDASGKFEFTELGPGRYRFQADRAGFAKNTYTGRALKGQSSTLALNAGQALSDVTLRVMPHGVITGRVTGLDDEPVMGAQVQTLGYVYTQAGKAVSPTGSATTNDLGEYRIFGLEPGKYFVSVTFRPQVEFAAQGLSRVFPKKAEEQYIQTYYPGVTDISSGAQIDVLPGSEARNINIRLARAKTVAVKGHVARTDLPDLSGQVMLTIAPRIRSGGVGSLMNRVAYTDAKGVFQFSSVPSGNYDLTAAFLPGNTAYTNRMQVSVGDEPIEDLTVPIGAGSTLVGRVRLEGDGGALPRNLQVRLVRLDPYLTRAPQTTAPVEADGTFAIPNVGPDRYEIQPGPYPPGYYLKSIRTTTRDVLRSGLDLLSGGVEPLEIVFSPAAGDISGVAQNSAGKPISNAVIALMPKDTEQRQRSMLRISTADQRGAFTLRGLAPGEYKLFAWEVMADQSYLDPDYMRPIESKGEAVTVRESSKQAINLRAIDSE